MAPSLTKKANVVENTNDGEEDFAVGSMEEVTHYTTMTLYRSVLFQMVLFGA